MKSMEDILAERLVQLGWKKFDVAKILAEKHGKKPTDVSSRISSTFSNPDGRSYGHLKEVIEAMGGEIVIRWTTTQDVPVR